MRNLRRWQRRPLSEHRVVLLATMLLAVLPLLVHVRPIRRLLPPAAARVRLRGVRPERTLALVRAVTVRLPWPCPCLPQALAAAWLLAWTGSTAVVTIGVRPVAEGSDAHAWTAASEDAADREAGVWQVVGRWSILPASTT